MSRQPGWRDGTEPPRQNASKPRVGCISVRLARLCSLVAPPTLARQDWTAAPAFLDAQKGVNSCIVGASVQYCRATDLLCQRNWRDSSALPRQCALTPRNVCNCGRVARLTRIVAPPKMARQEQNRNNKLPVP